MAMGLNNSRHNLITIGLPWKQVDLLILVSNKQQREPFEDLSPLLLSLSEKYIKMNLTSVTQKNVPSAIVTYYCVWYVFLRDRRYALAVW